MFAMTASLLNGPNELKSNSSGSTVGGDSELLLDADDDAGRGSPISIII